MKRRAASEKLDDVWLLLSDDVARLLSALLLIAMLAGSAYGSQKLVSVITDRAGIPEQLSSRFSGYMWMTTGWSIFLFFVVMVPLVLGACSLACVWTKWTLPDRPLLRAIGAATVPYLLIFAVGVLLLNQQYYVALGLILAAPVVLIVSLKELMGLRWSATAVTALLLLVGVPVTSLITFPISLWVNSKAMTIAEIDPPSVQRWIDEHPNEAQASGLKDARLLRQNQQGAGGFQPTPPSSAFPSRGGSSARSFESPAVQTAKRDPLFEQLQPLIMELQQADRQSRTKTREEIQQAFDRLAPQVNALKPANQNEPSPRWNVANELLKELQRRVQEAPSQTPPPEIFEAIVAGGTGAALQVPQAEQSEFLDDAFRFQDVRIRPLKRVKVNTDSFLRGKTTQRWDLTSNASIELELLSLRDPKQQRPWVADRRAIEKFAEEKNLLAFADEGYEPPQYGRIGETGWTRIVKSQPQRRNELQYVGRLPDQWLIVKLKSLRPTENEIDALDKFIQGIGYAKDPTATTMPAGAVAILPSGVAPQAPHVAVVAPGKNAGEINVLLSIVQGNANSWDKNDALKKLAELAPADAQQREVVAGMLEQLVATDAPFIADEAANTLAVWWRPQTVDVMLPLLDEQVFAPFKRQRAMKVLSKTGDKRVALPIMRWLLKDTDAVVAAMIALGPAAEDEAITRLHEKEAVARTAAARILGVIGTQKCLIELRRASNDPRDAGAAAAARSALETVLTRVKQTKATTTPTTKAAAVQ